MKTIKKTVGIVLSVLIIIIGVAGVIALMLVCKSDLFPESDFITLYILVISAFYIVAFYAEIAIHEAGHLVFGLLTGYKFVSFRVFGLMVARNGETGKLEMKKYSVLGTGGQCLMKPPRLKDDGKYAFHWALYNYGGVIFNVLSMIPAVVLLIFVPMPSLVAWLLYIFVILCSYNAVINCVMFDGLANDGYNGLIMINSPDARRVVWEQLEINAELFEGKLMREIPEEYFTLPPEETRRGGNTLMSAKGAYRAAYLMDKDDFEGAKALIDYMLENEPKMHKAHLMMLKLERIYIELITGSDGALITRLYDNQLKALTERSKNSLSACRFLYAYNLLYTGDIGRATKEAARFDVLKEKALYKSDRLSEDRFMRYAFELYNKRTFGTKE